MTAALIVPGPSGASKIPTTSPRFFFNTSEEACAAKPGAVGRPVFHAELRLMDHQVRAVAAGEVGGIAVRGADMMSGYWRDPMQTRETIRPG